MIKKCLIGIFLFICLIPNIVSASSNIGAKVGNAYYDTLEEAILNATSTDTIKLLSNANLEKSLIINKTVNIDLNGNNITAPTKVFQVKGGVLNITGSGTIKETEPNYGAIMVIGSDNINDKDYSIVNVKENVTLEGWSGIFINHESSKSYGVVVNFSGKINAIDDINGGNGVGIYVNGTIKDQSNSPTINILENAQINSTGEGLYIAGYSTFNIFNSTITGVTSGIGIKSGILNIENSTITCTGKDITPTEGNNNGINASGTTIQIESNSGYAGNIELNIKSGKFISEHSNVIYEYIGAGTDTTVKSINISNGKFISNSSKDVFSFSNSFIQRHTNFISGGEYSSNPNSYLKNGYTSTLSNNLYKVDKSTMQTVFSEKNISNNSSNILKPIIIILSILIITIAIYLNRFKILKLIKK